MRQARDLVHRGGRQVISSRAENTRDRKAKPILKEKHKFGRKMGKKFNVSECTGLPGIGMNARLLM